MNARLKWKIPVSPGSASPRGERFVLPARFEHQNDDWTENAWSLVVEVASPPSADGIQTVRVRFLMPDAPEKWLASGETFSLFEGSLWVAEGTIE